MKLSNLGWRGSLLSIAALLAIAPSAIVTPQSSTRLPDAAKVNPVPVPAVTKVDPLRRWDSYCESLPNSTGLVSTMAVTGDLRMTSNNTWLHSFDCPSGEYGVFLAGEMPAVLPWGNGILCISPFYPGLIRLSTPGLVPPDGHSAMFLDMNALPPQMRLVGKRLYFQCMFRDPNVGLGFNLSNGVTAVLRP